MSYICSTSLRHSEYCPPCNVMEKQLKTRQMTPQEDCVMWDSFPTASFFYSVQYVYSNLMNLQLHSLSCLTLKATAEALRVNVACARHLPNVLNQLERYLLVLSKKFSHVHVMRSSSDIHHWTMDILCAPVLTFIISLIEIKEISCTGPKEPSCTSLCTKISQGSISKRWHK